MPSYLDEAPGPPLPPWLIFLASACPVAALVSMGAWYAVPWFLDPMDSSLAWLARLPLFLAFGFAVAGLILGLAVRKDKGSRIMWLSLTLLLCFGVLFGINILMARAFSKMFD